MPDANRRRIVFSLLAAAGLAGVTRGDVLIRQNFEAAKAGDLPAGKQPVGTIGKLESDGDARIGSVSVAQVDATKGKTNAARIDNVAHKETRAPGLQLRWVDPKAGVVRVEYRFMTPIDGPFLSVHFFGGDWKTGAGVVMIENDKIAVQFGAKESRFVLGAHRAGAWHAVRLDFDVQGRTFDVFLDGRKRANRLPWQAGSTGVGRADLLADFRGTTHAGVPVLYIDDVVVQTVPAAK